MTTDTFAATLRHYRTQRRISQTKLAELANVDCSMVSRIEAGTRHPTRNLALRLATMLRLDAHDKAILVNAAGFLVGDAETTGPLKDVAIERERQNAKWGQQGHDDFVWSAILMEEVGEAAQAALHDRYGGSHAGTLREELIHCAAVAVQWVECIDRRAGQIDKTPAATIPEQRAA